MALRKVDQEFRLLKISYLDFKHTEMDRTLTALFPRIKFNGYPSRQRRTFNLTLEEFTREFVEHPEWFVGFGKYPDVVSKWIETHLMDVVNRGTPDQQIASPRPLHGDTYKFRNSKHARDYGTAQHIYWMLHFARHGRGAAALDQLKRFFFIGLDANTNRIASGVTVDVETQALLRLSAQVREDIPDTSDNERYVPLCVGQADLLADDLLRLMAYQRFIPRSVMVEYLKILIAFHLAIYHLKIFKLLPASIRRRGESPICAPSGCSLNPRSDNDPQGGCPYRTGLVIDVADRPGTYMAGLAERSADVHFRRISGFIKAYFTVKKLDEFASHLEIRGRLRRPERGYFTVDEVIQLQKSTYAKEFDSFFRSRLDGLLENITSKTDGELEPEIKAIIEMKLSDFETYIEIIHAYRELIHRRNITKCIDSLLLKNNVGALLAQRTRMAPRRFIVDSRLMEVLLQIAVLQPSESGLGFATKEIRVDELLRFLRERYGIYIDRLPQGDGFDEVSMEDREALRGNVEAFKNRLREIGFYRDLSDAYVTQTVSPRYEIKPEEDIGGKGGQP
jgi:hypothetical protein